MNILVTGCAGFIGFHTTLDLLKKYKVIGVDNLDNYYDVNLKKSRIKEIRKSPYKTKLHLGHSARPMKILKINKKVIN